MKKNPSPGGPLIELRQQKIEQQIDRILAEMPDSRLEAQSLIAEVTGKSPSAEVLHGFTQLAESADKHAVQTELERKLVGMRLLADLELDELTATGPLDRQVLDGACWRLPELIRRVEAFRDESDWSPAELGPSDLKQLGKLRKALMPDAEELRAFELVTPRVTRLIAAARDGRIDEDPLLSGKDADLFQASLAGSSQTCPDRTLLFAVALRWTIQEDLQAWAQAQAAREQEDGAGALPTTAPGMPVTLEKLEQDRNAYQALRKRVQAAQDAARADGQDELVQDLSAAQRALFAVYLELTAAVRNPAGAAADEEDPEAAETRARLLEEIQQVEESDAPRGEEAKNEALLDALTAVRDGKTQSVQLPPGARSLRRDRLRRRVLIGVAAVLAVVAVTVNVLLMMRNGRSTPIDVKAAEFSAAMPLNGVVPLGSTMFSEMPAPAWKGMPEDERMSRMEELGKLAQEKGFKRVLLTDNEKNELARWSVSNGVRILTP